ncbi:MAG: cation:proton antiporter [Chloroflexota bacterium]
MDETANLLIGLALILLSARMSAQIAVALKLPSVFGILLAGVLLGPSVTNLVPQSAALEGMSTIGVVLLLFVAGLETDLVQMRKVGTAALLAAAGGVAVPMAGAFFLSRYFGYGNAESVFIGTILTATSVTVSAHVLRELGYLQTKVGSAILGAAIIDDVIGVVVLTVVVNLEGGGSMFDLVRLGLFIPVSLYAGLWLVSLAVGRLLHNDSHDKYVEVLALVLAFAWAAQAIGGLAAISGAYLAGVLFGRTLLREDLADFGNLIGYALFAPIFFVTTGMMTDVRALASTPLFTSLLFVVAVLGKVVGSGVGALAGRFTTKESLAVGVGMVSRGEVAIVIAVLGRNSHVIDDQIFAASIVVTLLTTLATPLLLRLVLPGIEKTIDESVDAARRIRVETLIERLEG